MATIPSPSLPPESPPEPSLGDRLARALVLARRGRAYLRGAAVIFVLGVGISAGLTLRVQRSYQSECTFSVRSADKPGHESENALKRAAKIKDMVHERARLEAAIHKFKLYQGVVESQGMLDAVEAMKPHVGIRPRESGRYVISFDATEAEGIDARDLARDVTQFLAESITEDYAGGSIAEVKADAEFLAKEVATASTEIDAAVKAVTRFLSQHPEFGTDLPAGANIGVSAVAKKPLGGAETSSDPVLAALYRQRARLEADLKAVSAKPTAPAGEAVPRDKAVAAVDAATKAYAEAEADRASKSAKLTPEHPDMKAAQAAAAVAAQNLKDARARLAAIDAQNAQSAPAADPAAPTDSQADKLKQINVLIAAREAALKAAGPAAAPSDAGAEATPQLDLETEWQKFIRQLGEAKKRHDELKGKAEAMALAVKSSEASKAAFVSIIEPAYRPTKPVKGRRAMTALLGLASALAFAMLWVIARIMLEDRVSDAGDIDSLGLAPSLGTLPHIGGARPARTTTDALARTPPPPPASLAVARAVAESGGAPLRVEPVMPVPTAPEILAVLGDDPKPIKALRLVRHRLELLQAEGKRTFAITSAREGEGKTTFAAQVSLVLSESQRAKVALVEASFHRPALAEILGFEVPAGSGLSTQVVRQMREGGQPWNLLALGPSLHVLAESPNEARFPRALHSACFQDLLKTLAQTYDYVIIDAPCVLEGGEANALEPAVDGMIFVTRGGVSKKSELRVALRQLGARKTVGVALIAEPA